MSKYAVNRNPSLCSEPEYVLRRLDSDYRGERTWAATPVLRCGITLRAKLCGEYEIRRGIQMIGKVVTTDWMDWWRGLPDA